MNSKQRSTMKWRQKKETELINASEKVKRTLNGTVYEYPETLDLQFQKWSAMKRHRQEPYFFDGFYKQLAPHLQAYVILSNQ